MKSYKLVLTLGILCATVLLVLSVLNSTLRYMTHNYYELMIEYGSGVNHIEQFLSALSWLFFAYVAKFVMSHRWIPYSSVCLCLWTLFLTFFTPRDELMRYAGPVVMIGLILFNCILCIRSNIDFKGYLRLFSISRVAVLAILLAILYGVDQSIYTGDIAILLWVGGLSVVDIIVYIQALRYLRRQEPVFADGIDLIER